eukprot:1139875-Pelagomonas_calceolata.AAC.1
MYTDVGASSRFFRGVPRSICKILIEKERKVFASQVQLRALRKGPLTSKLARASPRLIDIQQSISAVI